MDALGWPPAGALSFVSHFRVWRRGGLKRRRSIPRRAIFSLNVRRGILRRSSAVPMLPPVSSRHCLIAARSNSLTWLDSEDVQAYLVFAWNGLRITSLELSGRARR